MSSNRKISIFKAAIFSLAFVSVTVFSIDRFYYRPIINQRDSRIENLIIQLEQKNMTIEQQNILIENQTDTINNLMNLCSEKNVFELIKNNTHLENAVYLLNHTVIALTDENQGLRDDKARLQREVDQKLETISELEDQLVELEKQLGLVVVRVYGIVNTTGWDQWT